MGVSIPPVRPDASTVRDANLLPRRQEDIATRARRAIQGARDAGLTGQDLQDVIAAWDAKIKRVNMNEAAQQPESPLGLAIAKTLAAPLAGVPGGRLAMSAARGLTDPDTPFAERQRQVNEEATEDLGSMGLGLAGSVVSAGAMPTMTGVKAGALFGGAEGVLSNSPDMSLMERGGRGLVGAGLGAATGGLADFLVRAGRVARATPRDVYANQLVDQRRMTTQPLYDIAEAEGQIWANSPGIGQPGSFSAPDLQNMIARLRNSRQYAGATDDVILNAAKRELNASRRGALEVADNSPDFNPGAAFKAEEANLAKQEMLQDADVMMPTLRKADAEFARQTDRINAFNEGDDAMSRVLNRKQVSAEMLPLQGEDAFVRRVGQMTQEELPEAAQGVLGATRGQVRWNPQFGFTGNVINPFVSVSRAKKFLNPIDAAMGNTTPSNLRDALMASAMYAVPEDGEGLRRGVSRLGDAVRRRTAP